MAIREFTDSAGNAWRVWDTIPRVGMLLPTGFADGWLTFESDVGRYRLTTVPADWEQYPAAKLEMLCRTARAREASRTRPIDARGPEGS